MWWAYPDRQMESAGEIPRTISKRMPAGCGEPNPRSAKTLEYMRFHTGRTGTSDVLKLISEVETDIGIWLVRIIKGKATMHRFEWFAGECCSGRLTIRI